MAPSHLHLVCAAAGALAMVGAVPRHASGEESAARGGGASPSLAAELPALPSGIGGALARLIAVSRTAMPVLGGGEPQSAPVSAEAVLTARPVEGYLTSAFGMRRDPLRTRRRKQHRGIDIKAERHTPVHAAGAGVVVRARRERGYGRVVYIDHGDGLETRYAHLQAITTTAGAVVAAGDVVGRVGSSGRATGPHLHFEVREHGAAISPEHILDLPLADAPLGPLAELGASLAALLPGDSLAPAAGLPASPRRQPDARHRGAPRAQPRSAREKPASSRPSPHGTHRRATDRTLRSARPRS